jgi:hypothetical protein
MFGLQFLLCFALQTFFYVIALGYQIDESCAKEGIENEVRDAMISALEMADAAHNRLTAFPLDPNTVDLIAKLFARPQDDPRNTVTWKTVDTLARILHFYRTEVPRGTAVGLGDVVCISIVIRIIRTLILNVRLSSVTENAFD